MRVLLTGVVEDGTPRAVGVPENPRAALEIPGGVDMEIVVSVVTSSGSKVPLIAPTELLFTVKKRHSDRALVSKTATLAGNEGTFALTSDETRRLEPGLLGYDVWLTKDGKRDPVVPLSPLQLLDSNISVG
ncbi:MAG: hypothetical protein KAJ19_12530 [Gammaproteobacteria bacterium]|nr:hypothetical protein [Gammaproteobacteria bacterium]